MSHPKTIILIPVYNHGATLRSVVEKALAQEMDVLVVDDGSDDHISPLLHGLDCHIHRLDENRGKGVAIQEGARIAQEHGYEAILTIDADGQHDPADAPKLINALDGQWPAMVIGDRQMGANVPKSSLFGRTFSNFWVRLETGLRLKDTQSGMRLYPVREITQLKLSKARYDFEIEVLVRSAWAGVPVLSTDISVYYPEPGKRISHFNPRLDNLRLTILHTMLVIRSLLPWPHKKVVKP
ncbi:MAG: glycosyltransferase family 2 protein, partial [Desulfobulbaceae bacterium]|nr:glycosyltransferase family 2 protein [Desulfobulbaceae bacterium]